MVFIILDLSSRRPIAVAVVVFERWVDMFFFLIRLVRAQNVTIKLIVACKLVQLFIFGTKTKTR